jgi:hypothetical protein
MFVHLHSAGPVHEQHKTNFFLEEAKTCPESFLRDTSTLLASQTAQRNSVPFSLGLVLTAWNLFLPLSDLKKSCTKEFSRVGFLQQLFSRNIPFNVPRVFNSIQIKIKVALTSFEMF